MTLPNKLMLSAAGLFMALSLTAAQAQTDRGAQAGSSGPGTAVTGGPGPAAPIGATPGAAGPQGSSQSAAGATASPGSANKSAESGDQSGPGNGAEGPGKAGHHKGKTAEQSAQPGSPEKAGPGSHGNNNKSAEDEANQPKGSKSSDTDHNSQGAAENNAEGAHNGGKNARAGNGQSGGHAKLEPQQVDKVKTYFSAHKGNVTRIDKTKVSVSIGVALPGDIALYDLPPDVVVVEGSCPVKYFAWGDDLVLVDSCTRQVVDIIPDIV